MHRLRATHRQARVRAPVTPTQPPATPLLLRRFWLLEKLRLVQLNLPCKQLRRLQQCFPLSGCIFGRQVSCLELHLEDKGRSQGDISDAWKAKSGEGNQPPHFCYETTTVWRSFGNPLDTFVVPIPYPPTILASSVLPGATLGGPGAV